MSHESIYLHGSEDVLRAAHTMAEAAESMRTTAMAIAEAADRIITALEELRQWAEVPELAAHAVIADREDGGHR